MNRVSTHDAWPNFYAVQTHKHILLYSMLFIFLIQTNDSRSRVITQPRCFRGTSIHSIKNGVTLYAYVPVYLCFYMYDTCIRSYTWYVTNVVYDGRVSNYVSCVCTVLSVLSVFQDTTTVSS